AHRPELRSSDHQAWPGPRHPQRHPPRGRVRAPGSALHATALDAGAAARDDAQGGVPARVAVSEVQPAADRRRIDRPGPSGRAQERTERDRQAGAPGAPARDRSRPERGRAALRSRPHASGPHSKTTRLALSNAVRDLGAALRAEVDLRREAQSLDDFGRRLRGNPRVRVPRVYREWCSARALVMEELVGEPLSAYRARAKTDPDAARRVADLA